MTKFKNNFRSRLFKPTRTTAIKVTNTDKEIATNNNKLLLYTLYTENLIIKDRISVTIVANDKRTNTVLQNLSTGKSTIFLRIINRDNNANTAITIATYMVASAGKPDAKRNQDKGRFRIIILPTTA